MIVNARMYSATPAAKIAWKSILGWATARAGVSWQYCDYDAPAPLAALWKRDDLGCVLMCGLPYSQRRPRPALIAAPVPSPRRYAGKPVYFTDLAVRADAPYARLEDTFGGVVGYTLRDSMSGYVALRRHLLPHRRAYGGALYRKSAGGLVNARAVIEALAAGRIDVGPLDSYYFDLLQAGEPDLAAKVRIIDSTSAAPIPPLVATGSISTAELGALRGAFTAAACAPELAPERASLRLGGFAIPVESSYDLFDSVLDAAMQYPETW